MRKITSLIALVVLTTIAMAQIQMNHAVTKSSEANLKQEVSKPTFKDDDAIWMEDFQGAENWTLGAEAGGKTWVIGDYSSIPASFEFNETGGTYFFPLGAPAENTEGTRFEVIEYREDRKWAWIDGITDLLNGTEEIHNTWIRFDNIDLTGVQNPKLSFIQVYRPLNQAYSFIDISTDGGTTWTAVEINETVSGNEYGDVLFDLFLGELAADQSDVSIKFRWECTDASISGYGYGWQIDEVKIVDNPVYDLRIYDTRMNFVDYVDYTVAGQESYYHISSHYGQLPVQHYDSPYALSWFNVAVENKGVETVAPSLKVTVENPEGTIVFDETMVGRELAITEKDTVDMIEVDFALGADPVIGEYIVTYEVFIEGQEDEDPSNNTRTANFFVTEYTMSRDAQNVSGSAGPGQWLSGGFDGDMIGTDYLFLYEEEIKSVDVYIDGGRTDAGTAFIVRVMTFDAVSESWVDLTTSTLITVEEEHLGDWVNVTFIDPAMVELGGEDATTVKIAIEFYYNGEDNDLFIGSDRSNKHSIWGTTWYFTTGSNAGSWFSLQGFNAGLALRVHTQEIEPESVQGIDANNINIYPNPTNGNVNIENVAGANIQIVNLMGQVVETITNANEFNTVDMSKYANGTYIVRIVKDSNVITHKFNLVD